MLGPLLCEREGEKVLRTLCRREAPGDRFHVALGDEPSLDAAIALTNER